MRTRLLGGGAEALPDYEVLEMLLFLGIPRRDTKPLAKSLINQLGGLPEVLSADPRHLRRLELGLDSIAAIKLVEAAADRLARAEQVERPVLRSWDGLMRYLDDAAAPPEGARVLFLDNRNRLLADEAAEPGFPPRAVLRRALALHATALILLTQRPGGALREADVATTEALRRAGAVLSVTLHDHLVVGGAAPLSLRREELI
ncbi:JAB domain-containing protein [Roseomonas elaeocarpi]|uniref:RadC family protein n=1 Tax=Roseomonas elaeocarpi TaxID=907779 RepID=A0ABV6JNL3_9PROT